MSNVKPRDLADLKKLLLSESKEQEQDLAAWFHARSPECASKALVSLAEQGQYSLPLLFRILLAAQWSPYSPKRQSVRPSISQLLIGELTRLLPTLQTSVNPRLTRDALEQLFRRVWRTNRWGDLTEEQADVMLAIAHYLVASNDGNVRLLLKHVLQKPEHTPYRLLVQETIASLLSPSVSATSLACESVVLSPPPVMVVGQGNSVSL